MATHSSTLAWEIPWMEEPGGLQSMESQRVEHDWATSLHTRGTILWLSENTDLGYLEINHIALKNCISFTCDFPACSRKVKEERGKTYELKCVIHHGKGWAPQTCIIVINHHDNSMLWLWVSYLAESHRNLRSREVKGLPGQARKWKLPKYEGRICFYFKFIF